MLRFGRAFNSRTTPAALDTSTYPGILPINRLPYLMDVVCLSAGL